MVKRLDNVHKDTVAAVSWNPHGNQVCVVYVFGFFVCFNLMILFFCFVFFRWLLVIRPGKLFFGNNFLFSYFFFLFLLFYFFVFCLIDFLLEKNKGQFFSK